MHLTRRMKQAALSTCALLTIGSQMLPAQPANNQSGILPVTITDPLNRFVTGLDKENFVVLENGTARPITYFSDAHYPIAIAIISESPLQLDSQLTRPVDEIIEATSVSEALRQLAASKSLRKAIIQTISAAVPDVPAGVQVIQIDRDNVAKAVTELRNQYLLRYQASAPSAQIEIVLKQPRGLPPLKTTWKAPF